MFKIFSVLLIIGFSNPGFAQTLDDTFKIKKTKDNEYKYEFSLVPSEHGTRNTLTVKLKCLKNNLESSATFEVCSMVKDSIKVKQNGNKLRMEFTVFERADFSEHYKEMDRGEESVPKCDPESKIVEVVTVKKC